jgi:oxaloacetate decarboxylase alpha subunit
MEKLTAELKKMAAENGVKLAESEVEDVLTYALFPQIGWRFLQNRGNPSAFEPAPGTEEAAKPEAPKAEVTQAVASPDGARAYTVSVNGRIFHVEVAPSGAITSIQPASQSASVLAGQPPVRVGAGEAVKAPMAGHILRINVKEGQIVAESEVVVVMEAMKMETEVRTRVGGQVSHIAVKVGDTVAANDVLVVLG